MGESQGQQWYLRFHGEAVGPFPAWQIARYLLLRRLVPEDEISRDKTRWYTLREIPEVLPEKRLQAASLSDRERRRLEATRRWVEEHPELFVPLDQAQGVEDELLLEEEVYHPQLPARRPRPVGAYLIALALVAAVVVIPFLLPEGVAPDLPQCDAAPAAGVNWSNCLMQGRRLENQDLSGATLRNANLAGAVLRASNLAGADLAYTNLSASNLRGANLRGARLTGADLRGSELQSADLRQADLSYADLTDARLGGARLEGAKLGYAIMDEVTLCMPDSVGRCIPARR
ncbi:MAG: pentapeptide repeat-containing protein [Pseudomonadota bacterium]